MIPEDKTFICKKLDQLPPITSEWQQSCKQPKCSHYCNGECCNPGRSSVSSPCPFDGKELPLTDAEDANFVEDTTGDELSNSEG